MDKRFPSTGKQDPFAFKPEYNKGVGPAAPVQAPTESSDPFSFKPEYNKEVKKKVGGTELQTVSPESSPTPSTSQLPVETASDFLVKDVDNSDFYEQMIGETQKYLSSIRRTQGTDPAIPITDIEKGEIKKRTKEDILNSPLALANYNKTRIDQLNKKIKDLQTQQKQYVTEDYYGGRLSTPAINVDDPVAYNNTQKQIAETQNYINKLKGNVEEVATDMVVSKYTPANYDPKKVGRELIAISDPDLDAQFKMVEKSGMTLPGIRSAENDLRGIIATKNYLLKQPESIEKESFLKLVNDYENEFDERNPDIAVQRVREKVGARIYKGGLGYTDKDGIFRPVESSSFGFGYSPEALKLAAEDPETGLTNSEKKIFYSRVLPVENKIIGTNIPTSGFTRSFFNAFEKGGLGIGRSIGDIVGIRDEGDQAYDALNQEIEQSRYRAPGESPTAQTQLAFLNQKEATGKLTQSEQKVKKDLQNYVGVRNNWSKFKDGAGDLTGQVAQIVLLTRGIGATGGLLSRSAAAGDLLGGMTRGALGTVLSNETTGLILAGYLNSYDNYKQQAIQLMPRQDQAAERDAYAKTMASVEGVSELIFRDTKILKAFSRNVAPTAREVTQRLINGEITQQVAREEFQAALQKYLKPFAKNFVKAEVSEATEEAVVDVAQGIAESVFAGTNFDAAKVGNQALHTFLTTMLYSPLVSGMAAHGAYRQNKSQNAFIKSSLLSMATNPAEYLKSVEDLQLEGAITQDEANEKIQLIKSANKFLAEIPAARSISTTNPEGTTTTQAVPMDYPQVTSYLLHRLNEGIIEDKLEKTTDPIVQQQLNKELKRSQEIRKGIYDGTIGVTPDIQDVTDNPEQAAELGIADSNQMLPDELIGTPFEGQQDMQREEIERLIDEGISKGYPGFSDVLRNVAQSDPDGFMKFIADQSLGRTETGEVLNMALENTMRNEYGDAIVDKAIKLFPLKQPQRSEELLETKINSEEKKQAATDFEYSKDKMNKAYIAADEVIGEDYQGNAENAVNSAIQSLTGSSGGKGRSKYYDTGKKINGKDVLIRVSNHSGYSASEYKSRHGNTGIEAFDRMIQAEPDNHIISIIVNEKGKRNQDYINRDGITEIHIDGIKDVNSFNESMDYLMNELESVGFDLSEKNIQKNEGQNQETTPASQEGSEEISIPETTREGNESQGEEVLTEQGAEPIAEAPITEEKTISEKGKELANRIRQLKSRRDIAQANIFGIAVGIYDGAIETVATAIEAGAALAEAINQGIQYIRDNGGENLDEKGFREHLEDIESGRKPKVKIQVGEEQQVEEEEEEEQEEVPTEEEIAPSIDDYRMTTSDKIKKFMSGDTWDDVFGEAPEGNQTYEVQTLSDMLQDGRNMIAIAQQKWGGDVMMYGKPLFQLIQQMSNDAQLSNKKAVLLATFLGELQEAKLRSPERAPAINQLEKPVFAYYQNYMNMRGKEVVAGRLLRLYRDKYIGDIFADRILEEQQVKEKNAIQEVEQKRNIDNETAAEGKPPVTKEQKTKEDKAAKDKSTKDKKKQDKKKKSKPNEAKEKAEQKLKEIEANLGSDSKKGLIARIKDTINKLNCK